MQNTTATADGPGVKINGPEIMVTSSGTYEIKGTLTNGRILVDTDNEAIVKLLLNQVNITCSYSAPMFIIKARKVVIGLINERENFLQDGPAYFFSDGEDEPKAALFSKCNLSIFGTGILNVTGNYKDGISCKDGLIIKSGTINITSADDGIRGKDYLVIRDGRIKISCGGDGMKSDLEGYSNAGYVYIEDGKIDIETGKDAISAVNEIKIRNGSFTLTSGGGSSRTVPYGTSAKGIKGIASTFIEGGIFLINSADDALHSNNSIQVIGGSIIANSADDGIHADNSVEIRNTEVAINKSFEGIESATITIENSTVRITATDDCINATHGAATEMNDNSNLNIKSGYIYINATKGDGLDSNGNITISGGTVIVNGPSSQPEVGVDCNGTFKIDGGTVIVSGIYSNMTDVPSASSSQCSVFIVFSTSQAAGKIVHIEDSGGKSLLTFTPIRNYQSIIFSSPDLMKGNSYSVFSGGSATGEATDGLYFNETYTGGSIYKSFTICSVQTTVGNSASNPRP
ncbi:MAG: carbohydrate-binding domain-containing protein [Bacteroidales bacterium]|nr:carbohydrate-binding domain-containing protein [Bacteroidales bacterium]